MPSAASLASTTTWLTENGPKKLELLFRAIVYHPSAPILITDNDRHYSDASSGAGKLLGLSREEIIGRSLDEFVEPGFQPQVSELWQDFLERGEQVGTLPIVGPDGRPREVNYTVKANVLPVRHLLVLADHKDKTARPEGLPEPAVTDIPAWVQDYALFLLGVDGNVETWYSGAERIYGYTAAEAIGSHVALLYPAEDTLRGRLQEVEQVHYRRTFRRRRLVREKRRDAILGQSNYDGPQGRRRDVARFRESGARF